LKSVALSKKVASLAKPLTKTNITQLNNLTLKRSVNNSPINLENATPYGNYFGLVRLIIKAPSSILLGESRYYYVQEVHGNYIIKDTTLATYTPAIACTDWNVNIYENKTDGRPNGQKLGVYWETEKPIYGTNNINLALGLIRLVGRYWTQDSVYNVMLSTTYNGKELTKIIEVKKPDILGNPGLTDTERHTYIKDVKNQDLWLDETIFKYAGKWGIPPQIIKGQIEKETSFRNIWRYEPFKDIEIQDNITLKKQYFKTGMPFIVTESSMGGDLPASHTNEYPNPYSPIVVRSSYVNANWFGKYVQRHTGEKPDKILGASYLGLNNRWINYYSQIKLENKNISDEEARSLAHDSLKSYIQDPKNKIGKKFNDYAQTRVVTSYGLIQMMYTTAVTTPFSETGSEYGNPGSFYMNRSQSSLYPEMLNEYEWFFPRYVDLTLKNLRKTLGDVNILPDNNWTDGYESVWIYTLQRYNPGDTNNEKDPLYGIDILKRTKNYISSMNQ